MNIIENFRQMNEKNEIMIRMIQAILADMSGGNPGALTVLRELIVTYPSEFFMIVEKMKRHKIENYHIWLLYKKYEQQIDKFVAYVQELD